MRQASLALLVALTAPAPADAFYDSGDFATPAVEGGGGGRYFTGSPADGQTCATCHTGGQPPSLSVAGVPTRYVPGATYELSVTWPPEIGDVSAMLEVTDEHGIGAGTLAVPPSDLVADDELCEPRSQHVFATRLFSAANGRAIAGVSGCGASAVRVQWTAPRTAVGLVWFSGAAVVSNQQGDVTGDGATSFVMSVPSFGEQPAPAQHGCSVSHGAGSASFPALLAAFVLGALLVRGRRSTSRRRWPWLCLAAGLLMSCQEDSLLDPGAPRSMGPVTLHFGGAVDAWDAAQRPLDSGAMREPPVEAGADADVEAQVPLSPSLQFQVTTLPLGGAFAPKNVGAIWVQDASGHWVKTLALWATSTLRYLSRYVKANQNGNTVDAITSATLTTFQAHTATWDLTGADGVAVPDGTYHLLVEVTDRNGPGQVLDLEFVKGAGPQTVTPADTPFFAGVQLIYTGK